MRKSFSEVKKASDDYISMTFYLMCYAMHTDNDKVIKSWYGDLLTQTCYAEDIGILSEDERCKIYLACTAVF